MLRSLELVSHASSSDQSASSTIETGIVLRHGALRMSGENDEIGRRLAVAKTASGSMAGPNTVRPDLAAQQLII